MRKVPAYQPPHDVLWDDGHGGAPRPWSDGTSTRPWSMPGAGVNPRRPTGRRLGEPMLIREDVRVP